MAQQYSFQGKNALFIAYPCNIYQIGKDDLPYLVNGRREILGLPGEDGVGARNCFAIVWFNNCFAGRAIVVCCCRYKRNRQ
jgi:hypothetical protein